MQVIGYDYEEPLFTGPGHISITRTEMEFVMRGTLADEVHAFENPYVNLNVIASARLTQLPTFH